MLDFTVATIQQAMVKALLADYRLWATSSSYREQRSLLEEHPAAAPAAAAAGRDQ